MMIDLKMKKINISAISLRDSLYTGDEKTLDKEVLEILILLLRDFGNKIHEIENILSLDNIENPDDLGEFDYFFYTLI